MLSMPVTKEVVTDPECGGAWVNNSPGQISYIGVKGSNPGDTGLDVRSKPAPFPVMIGLPTISPECGLIRSLQVGRKLQITYPEKLSNAQTLNNVVDGQLPDDQYSASNFSKIIGSELSHGSSDDLYLRCRMNFLSNFVQTLVPQFVDLGLLSITILNESGALGTPVTRIRRPMDGSH